MAQSAISKVPLVIALFSMGASAITATHGAKGESSFNGTGGSTVGAHPVSTIGHCSGSRAPSERAGAIRLIAEFLGADEETLIELSFDSADEVVRVGDVISLRGGEICAFDIEKMKSRYYKVAIHWKPDDDTPSGYE